MCQQTTRGVAKEQSHKHLSFVRNNIQSYFNRREKDIKTVIKLL